MLQRRHRTAVLLLTFASLASGQHAGAQHLLPNGGFEVGADQPAGWRLEGGGTWMLEAGTSNHIVKVSGAGNGSSSWQTSRLPLKPGGLYRLSFRGRKAPGATGGCAVSGLSRVNRDFQFTDDWQRYSFAFSVPDDGTSDFLRLGQWEVKGEVFFDDVEVLPVLPAHYSDLGEAESLRDGTYRFTPDFGWAGANFHRPLHANRANFNSDRWLFSAGSEVVYRFALPYSGEQTNGRVRINVNHYVAGTLVVEARGSGEAWQRVATFDGQRRSAEAELPAALFPAKEVFLRLSVEGTNANLQVNACDYVAGVRGLAAMPEGLTQFYTVEHDTGEVGLNLRPLNTRWLPGDVRFAGSLTNLTQRKLQLDVSLVVEGRAGNSQKPLFGPGESGAICPRAFAGEPGNYPVKLKIAAEAGSVLLLASTEAQVRLLYDPRPGHWLAGDDLTEVWWCESGWKLGNYQLQPDSPVKTNRRPVTVSAARGETEAAQILITSLTEGALESATIEHLRGPTPDPAKIELTLHEIARVPIQKPTDSLGDKDAYPDPLPLLHTPFPLPRWGNQALWLSFHIARDAKPGDYSGELKLRIDGDTFTVPLAVHVYDFALPEETHLQSAFGLGTHAINQYHKLTRREDQVAVYERYLQNFAEHRISPYSFYDYAPIKVNFPGKGTNQHAQVDFTEFDRAAGKWLGQGGFSTFQLQLQGMGGGTFQSRSLGKLEGFTEGTPEHTRLFQDYLGQVERHLRDRGWLPKAFTYWFDEPDPKDYEFVVAGMKRLKAAAPGLRRMLTEQPEPALLGNVDVWCGLTPEWTPERVRARRAAGEEVWWYICCAPKAPYVTEFIDHPGTELRLWPWQSWQYGVTGILIWETVYWNSPLVFPTPKLQDPWKDPMSYTSGYDLPVGHVAYWGNGDGRFLYPPRRDPNTATNACLDAPITSIRWENLRDGMEDYEYFWLLDQEVRRVATQQGETDLVKSARALLQVPPEVSKDLTHFTTDPRVLLAHRDRVARMIEKLQHVR